MKNVNVIFVDATQNYPLQFSAGNTKVEFMANGLILEGASVSVINSLSGSKEYKSLFSGQQNKIRYFIFPQKLGALLSPIANIFKFIRLIKKLKQKGAKNVVIIDYALYPYFLLDVVIAKLFGFKLVLISHEWHISFNHKGLKGLSNYLFDKTFGYFANAILPISSYLMDQTKHFNKPMLKLPILADFEIAQQSSPSQTTSFFLYCGHARFLRLITVLLDAYNLHVQKGYKQELHMVLGGDVQDVAVVKQKIEELSLTSKVKIETKLPFEVLLQKYQDALALLLPLSPESLQDKARFSQKIAEYLSSRRPMITVAVGEINQYFTDKETAYIAQDLTAIDFANQMETVAKNIDFASKVGKQGFELGKQNFDYRINGKRLHDFLLKL